MRTAHITLTLLLMLLMTGCTSAPVPRQSVETDPHASAEPPMLDVYVTQGDAIVRMDIESYVAGVVAGEMPGDWPLEALKAQAILARTFVLKFVTEKDSRYSGADISTDITEAQAYDAEAVNERILTAVQQTAGEILMNADGTLPYTWFHAHSGGMTALARESLDWQRDEPSHTRVTAGLDSDAAPESAKVWTAEFTAGEFVRACREAGSDVTGCGSVAIGETGPSGRAVTLLADGRPVSAARLRIALGSTRMRSTLLTALTAEDGIVRMSGRGYGHGVGMPQWGAFALAEDGMCGEDIALHYYTGLHIVRVW